MVFDYTYDELGNRTMTGYSTGDHNRLASDGTWNYTYDNEGAVLSKTNIAPQHGRRIRLAASQSAHARDTGELR